MAENFRRGRPAPDVLRRASNPNSFSQNGFNVVIFGSSLTPWHTMAKKRKILFVVNPISGGRKKDGFEDRAESALAEAGASLAFAYTKRPGHAHELARDA